MFPPVSDVATRLGIAHQAQASQQRFRDVSKAADSRRNRCSAQIVGFVPMDEIATAIARCAGCLADSFATEERIYNGEGSAVHYDGASSLLRPSSMSYDASAARGDRQPQLCLRL